MGDSLLVTYEETRLEPGHVRQVLFAESTGMIDAKLAPFSDVSRERHPIHYHNHDHRNGATLVGPVHNVCALLSNIDGVLCLEGGDTYSLLLSSDATLCKRAVRGARPEARPANALTLTVFNGSQKKGVGDYPLLSSERGLPLSALASAGELCLVEANERLYVTFSGSGDSLCALNTTGRCEFNVNACTVDLWRAEDDKTPLYRHYIAYHVFYGQFARFHNDPGMLRTTYTEGEADHLASLLPTVTAYDLTRTGYTTILERDRLMRRIKVWPPKQGSRVPLFQLDARDLSVAIVTEKEGSGELHALYHNSEPIALFAVDGHTLLLQPLYSATHKLRRLRYLL